MTIRLKNRKVAGVMKAVGTNPESVIAKRDGDFLTEEEKVRENDLIELIRIVSGG